MRMKPIARVQGSTMIAYQDVKYTSPPVEVDSDAWRLWLQRGDSFSYHDPDYGSCTVRCEKPKAGNQWYWRAYRTCGKKLRKVYLGVAAHVTLARLQEAAVKLACPKPDPAPWNQDNPDHEYFPDKETIRQAQKEIWRLQSAKRFTTKDRQAILAIAEALISDLAGAHAVIEQCQDLLEEERKKSRARYR